MRKMNALTLLLGLVAALVISPITTVMLPSTAAAATDYYVDAVNGLNTNNGTSPGSAWQTIGKAGSTITAGAIVHVAPGTYSENTIILSASGTAANPIIYISDTKWGAKIKNSNTGTKVPTNWFVLKNNGDYVTIDGFDIEGSTDLCSGIINNGGNTSMINNHVHDVPAPLSVCGTNGGGGIVDGNYSKSNDDIIGNYVHNIGSWPTPDNGVHGIYHSNLGGHVMNNISFRNAGWGIHLWHAADGVVVSNNTTFNNNKGGILFGAGDSPGGVVADNMVITNNIAVNNDLYGIREYAYTPSALGSNNKIYNNIAYNNPTANIATIKATTSGNITNAGPDFVNYTGGTNGDYHLLSTSPGIDSGTSLGAPSYDYGRINEPNARNPRPIGAGYDIGAYEFTGSINVAAGKTFTGSSLTNAAYMTDGITNNSSQYGTVINGAQSVKLDLGASYNLTSVNLWHYYADARSYHDVIVQLSNDVNFASGVTTVFNNDTNNSAGQGTGTDAEYVETSAGKEVTFSPVNARYVRLWTNGSTANNYGHYMEVQVWQSTPTNQAAGKTFTGSSLTNAAYITDGITTNITTNYGTVINGAQSVKVDLGASYDLTSVKVWHYYPDARTYHDVILQLSNDVNFASGVTTVFNNDTNNSAGQGTGTDAEYVETSAGKDIGFSSVNARYVRLWTNGSTANTYGHYIEVEAWGQ